VLRILIADDHAILRKGMRQVIERHPDWHICGEAADGREALSLALREKPDVAILDVSLPGINGIALTGSLLKSCPSTQVLPFTMHDDDETVNGGLAAGARGYVLKADTEDHLEAAITALESNNPYFSSSVSDLLMDAALNRPSLDRFTVGELEVARLIGEGNSSKQIARSLGISLKMVASRRSAAMRKARVRTAAQFILFGVRHNLIQA
jgi:DNA-binding NarL/FixJ family response regulator